MTEFILSKYIVEILMLGAILGGFQSLYFLRKNPKLALRWFIRTAIGVAVSIVIVSAVLCVSFISAFGQMPLIAIWISLCVFPFSCIGITIGVFQASLLTGRIKPIYLCTACASSIIGGIVSGVIVSYTNNLEAEAGMFGPYWENGLSIAILAMILIYGLATSIVLPIFWREEDPSLHSG